MIIKSDSKISKISDKSIQIGLLIFAIGSPFSISLAQFGLISALLFWAFKFIFVKKVKIKGTFLDLFFLLIIIGRILGSLFSIDIINSLLASKQLWLISIIYLIYNNVNLKQGLKILKFILISSVVIGLYGLWQSFTGIDILNRHLIKYGPILYGAKGGFGLHLTYGGYQMMTGLILLSIVMYGMKNYSKKNKILISTGAFIVNFSVVMSFARTAWIGLMAGCFLLVILGFVKKSRKQIIFLIALILIFIIFFFIFDGFRTRIVKIYTDLHYSDRTQLWGGAIDMIKDNPIFGVGTGMFDEHFLKYRPDYNKVYGHTHNDFLGAYLRTGIVGFIGYMMLWIMFFIKMIKLAFNKFKDDKFLFSLTIGLVASIFSFLIAGLGQNYFTDSENIMLVWFVFGFSMILYYTYNKKSIKTND